ncbi:hypothetical protein D6D15_02888 [Aureobasidium pullulans]|uniref:ARID domain-containing protein n=1 Tax=Aureobasidium pullulans TaxID=5580 RepID=A0A4S9BHA7_AURPU|nr:hypothetical protein D6D15_02888 [Aureobasidium pullulans]
MPPKGSKFGQRVERESSIEKTEEYENFLKELAVYHEQRGTTLEVEPKVEAHHIDLLKLYHRVVEEGGYDLVSDTKKKPLMWRKIAEELLPGIKNLAGAAFLVKRAYYYNLVAYEISTHWKKDPPPKEVVEDVTAKGGDVMSRTLENYPSSSSGDKGLANGHSSDNEDDAKGTNEDGEPGSVRSTRGLRHAPPQRVLFQPEVNPSRTRNQGQHPSQPPASPSPAYNNTTPMTLATYEPQQQVPLTLKPVTTPANNSEYYRLKRKQQQEAQASHVAKKHRGLMLPGTGFIGPNIYVRAQLALQSGLPEEEEYALHHLVKISHERGDKYRFDQFPGLAEALINKLLQVSTLFYDLEWIVSYEESSGPRTLDAINGTPDLLQKLQAAVPLDTANSVETTEFRQALGRITEAGLVIRNMVMLDENAQYIAKLPLLRDYFCIVLNLPSHPALVELQYYALETIEQLTKHYDLDATDLLYETLLAQLESNDRGRIVTSLRAISRLGMSFEENKRLELVPLELVQKLPDWMMLPDEELRSACLDFLFQYTTIADNVETLVLDADVQGLVRQLSNLLLYNAKKEVLKTPKPRPSEPHYDSDSSAHVPRLSQDVIEQLLQYKEPDRSSHWLRMCFEIDPDSEMTQIHLWQSYSMTFSKYQPSHGSLIAGEFIKNVSNTFTGASAQVANSKYVIRGIRPRKIAHDINGKELVKCCWRTEPTDHTGDAINVFANENGKECGEFFLDGQKLMEHILISHLKVPTKAPTAINGDIPQPPQSTSKRVAFDFASVDSSLSYSCKWSSCSRQATGPSLPVSIAMLARHIYTHLPDTSPLTEQRRQHQRDSKDGEDPVPSHRIWYRTITDERGDPAGLPLGSALVLRNIARGVRKMAPNDNAAAAAPASAEEKAPAADGEQSHRDGEDDEGSVSMPELPVPASAELMKKIFDPIRDKLFFAFAHNPVLSSQLSAVIRAITAGGG